MQTKKALAVFAKSASNGNEVSRTFASSAAKYIEQYERDNAEIERRKQVANLELPFLLKIREKVAKAANVQLDDSMPVVGKFDIYSSIKRIAERSAKDRGLKRLASQLEKAWRDDMSGSMSYGQLRSLVAVYSDQFPKSKAVEALQSEAARIGYHKLPVAKLTRIASRIKNQSDYDIAVEVNGYSGDHPEQIRAREFIRAIAERNAAIAERKQVDRRTAEERALDAVSELEKEAVGLRKPKQPLAPDVTDFDSAVSAVQSAKALATQLRSLIDQAAMEMHANGLDNDGQVLINLSNELDQWISQLSLAGSGMVGNTGHVPSDVSQEEDAFGSLSQPGGIDVPLSKRKTYKGLSPSERKEMSEAGVGYKWWDPRTWSHQRMAALIDALDRASAIVQDRRYARTLEKFAQLLPPPEELESGPTADEGLGMGGLGTDTAEPLPKDNAPVPLPTPEIEGLDLEPASQDLPADLENAVVELQEAEAEAVDMARELAPDYVAMEEAEGLGSPGSVEWAVNEVVEEGHTEPPFHQEWLDQEAQEHAGDMPVEAKRAAMSAPKKGMPMPDKIKSQPDSSVKRKLGPKDALRVLKAENIERSLLSGNKVRVGSLSIFINDQDEIEMWRGTSGKAAPLSAMDIVIEDFRRMAQMEIVPPVMPEGPPMAELGMSDLVSEAEASSVPLDELVSAALTNYKAQGMTFPDAMKEFNKEHSKRMKEWQPMHDALLIDIAKELWTGTPTSMILKAAVMARQAAGVKMPKLSKPADKVKPGSLGKDSEGQELLPLPSKINTSVKPGGKMSDTDLGKDTQGLDNVPNPGAISSNPNVQKGKPGVKLPDTNLGKSMEGNVPKVMEPKLRSAGKREAQIKNELPPMAGELARTHIDDGVSKDYVVVTKSPDPYDLNADDVEYETCVYESDQNGNVKSMSPLDRILAGDEAGAMLNHRLLEDAAMTGQYTPPNNNVSLDPPPGMMRSTREWIAEEGWPQWQRPAPSRRDQLAEEMSMEEKAKLDRMRNYKSPLKKK